MAERPSSQPEGPWIPAGMDPVVFDTFIGIDTSSSRPAIADEAMAWCDGFMPIGKSNLRTLYGVGTPIYNAPGGLSIVFFDFANLGAVPYMILLLSDGSLVAVNLNSGIPAAIAPAGTISAPSSNSIGVSQWGSQYIIIVANEPNGYWLYDGVNFFQSGTLGPDIVIVNGGLDYTSSPTITAVGGHGSGATFTSTIFNGSVVGVTTTNPGTGYVVEDGVFLAFSGGGSPGETAIYAVAVTAGALSTGTVINPGAGYTSAATVQFLGGGGSGGEGTVQVSAGTVAGISISAGGQGYNFAPATFITDPNNPVAQAYIDIMPFGVQGTAVETYQSRVWVVNGPELQFTAPESIVDFATSDGGGFFTSVDSFLRVGFTQPIQTNGFLYLIADSSINYISGVQTSGNPPTTTFSNQNADPEIGSVWANSVDVFSRNIVFGNAFGAHVSYGGAVTKISQVLDGVYNTVPNFGGFIPSAAKAIIFGRKVWMLLLPVIDPITNSQVNKLFMWDGKSWWSSQQDVPLIYIQHQEINSVLTAHGTDGSSVYPLFQTPSTAFSKTVQSKLWDRPSYIMNKTETRLFGLANYYSLAHGNLTISIDNEDGIGSGSALVSFPAPAQTGVVAFSPVAVGQQGALLGLTITTTAADMAIISMTVAAGNWAYKG